MAATIQSLVNGINPVVAASRNDLRTGDLVQLDHVGAPATTYAWSLAYTPQDRDRTPSTAVLAGNVFGPGPVTFTVDNEGSYLIRLVIDAGLPTQDEQYVRLRFLTVFGQFSLVAAGERRDGTGIIPVDVSAQGWADDQNFNLNHLSAFVERTAASGRIIYVDANRGKDNNNAPNTPSIAEGYADFSNIQDAINAAVVDANYNGGIPPSSYQPIIVAVRPGFYVEDLEFKPYVHVIGWPSTGGGAGQNPDNDRTVTVRCANLGGPPAATHTANLPLLGEYAMVSGLVLENTGATTNALLRKIGEGDVYIVNCELLQTGGGAPSQGAGLSVERGRAYLHDCRVVQQDVFSPGSLAFEVQASPGNTARLVANKSAFLGTSIAQIDVLRNGGSTALLTDCELAQVGADPLSFGVQTWAEDVYLDGCNITAESGGITDVLQANPDLAGAPGDLKLRVRQGVMGTNFDPPTTNLGISMDDTNVVGTASLFLGSSEYSTLTTTPGVVVRALTLSTTLYYDDSLSGLGVNTVQEAIDAVAGGGGAPVNASYLTLALDPTLTQERFISPVPGEIVGTDLGPNNAYTVGLSNTAVVPGTYTRATVTVDAKGRLTAAASDPGLFQFSRTSVVPIGAAIIPPFTVDDFDIIPFPFTFAGGGTGPVRIYLDQPLALAPGSVFVDVLVGPPGGLVSVLAAPYDISAIPALTLATPTMGIGPFAYGVGDIILFRVTYNVVPVAGDGLILTLAGNQG